METSWPSVPSAIRDGPAATSRALSEPVHLAPQMAFKKGIEARKEGGSGSPLRREPPKWDQRNNNTNNFRGGGFRDNRRFVQKQSDPRRRDGRFPMNSATLSPSPSPQRSQFSPSLRGMHPSPRTNMNFDNDLNNVPDTPLAPDDLVSWYEKAELLDQFKECPRPEQLEDEVAVSDACLPPVNLSPPSEAEQAAKASGPWWILSRAFQASRNPGRRLPAWRDRQTFRDGGGPDPLSRSVSMNDDQVKPPPEQGADKLRDLDSPSIPPEVKPELLSPALSSHAIASPVPIPGGSAMEPLESWPSPAPPVADTGQNDRSQPIGGNQPLAPRPARWFYKDPQGNTQGPFSGDEMRAWYDEGFFKLDLEIQRDIDIIRGGTAPFIPLREWFARGDKAFLDSVPAPPPPPPPQRPADWMEGRGNKPFLESPREEWLGHNYYQQDLYRVYQQPQGQPGVHPQQAVHQQVHQQGHQQQVHQQQVHQQQIHQQQIHQQQVHQQQVHQQQVHQQQVHPQQVHPQQAHQQAVHQQGGHQQGGHQGVHQQGGHQTPQGVHQQGGQGVHQQGHQPQQGLQQGGHQPQGLHQQGGHLPPQGVLQQGVHQPPQGVHQPPQVSPQYHPQAQRSWPNMPGSWPNQEEFPPRWAHGEDPGMRLTGQGLQPLEKQRSNGQRLEWGQNEGQRKQLEEGPQRDQAVERERLERMERDRMERDRMERERDRMERDRMERDRMERERLEPERLERERVERERLERDRQERARLEREDQERQAQERLEQEDETEEGGELAEGGIEQQQQLQQQRQFSQPKDPPKSSPQWAGLPKKATVLSMFEIQREEREIEAQAELRRQEEKRYVETSTVPTEDLSAPGPAWGGAGLANKKSLSQIQEEQGRLEQQQLLARQQPRRQESPRLPEGPASWKGGVAPRTSSASKSLLDIQKEQQSLSTPPVEQNLWNITEPQRAPSAPRKSASETGPTPTAWRPKPAPSPPAVGWAGGSSEPKPPVAGGASQSWAQTSVAQMQQLQQQLQQQQLQLLQQIGVVKPQASASVPSQPSASSASSSSSSSSSSVQAQPCASSQAFQSFPSAFQAPQASPALSAAQQPVREPSQPSPQPKDARPEPLKKMLPDPAAAKKASPKVKRGKGNTANVFGGPSMSLEMEEWCKVQLDKFGADMTLAHYLMTIDSPSQIEDYIRQYLGSAEGWKEFSAGFLQHKQFDTDKPQEDARPVVKTDAAEEESAKKNRRRRGGAKKKS